MKVQNIFDFLNSKFPTNTACNYDNVGILVGDPKQDVTTAVVTLDCSFDVINFAIKNNAQLIITHHPVIFHPLKNVLKNSIPYELIRNNISVISMHTNMDIGSSGVNDTLCKLLSPLSVETVISSEDGFPLKKCTFSPINADDFAKKLKSLLGGTVKYTDSGKAIEHLLVCSGSGGDFITDTIKFGCDALLTGDVKHDRFQLSDTLGVSLFDAGHFNTEDVIVKPLKNLLALQFPEIKFFESHISCIKHCF